MVLKNQRILFYDGDCGLCSRSVRFLMRRDKVGILRFAPIQGETAEQCLADPLRESLSTVVYQRPGVGGESEILLRSEAVLCAVIDIRSHWRWLASLLHWIPRTWSDAAYNWIARNRHTLFPKDACTLPNEAERRRLLP